MVTQVGKYDLDVTTFQMAVLFCWENRRYESLTLENLRLATELPETELRKTLWSLVAFPKLKRQVLLYSPTVSKPSEFTEETLFKINHDFGILKNSKLQKRGKLNLIGRLQLSTEKARKEENESIMQLRILRTQEAIIKILKMRKVIVACSFIFKILRIMFWNASWGEAPLRIASTTIALPEDFITASPKAVAAAPFDDGQAGNYAAGSNNIMGGGSNT